MAKTVELWQFSGMEPRPLRLLVLVAHPDDAEAYAGGLMTRYRRLGHAVRWVSLTSGDAGHHVLRGQPLAERRAAESAEAAAVIGCEHAVWEWPDGHLQPTLELRWRVVEEIRLWRPDLVLAHRLWDYHPDHRAAAQLVQDACYLVTVPGLVPGVPGLRRDPVAAFLCDGFQTPAPFRPDVVLDVTPEAGAVVEMLDRHVSQVYEWLPFHGGVLDQVPEDAAERKAWLAAGYTAQFGGLVAERFRGELASVYGPERAAAVRCAEAFEISEYARQPGPEERAALFPLG